MTDVHDLIAEGQALVRSLALRAARSVPVKVELDDLIAYGELGLAEAARDFDPSRGNQFITFAYYRIRGAIYDGLAKMTWTSRARYRRMRYESLANHVLESEQAGDDGAPKSAEASGEWFARTTERLVVVYTASDGDPENNPLDAAEDPEATAPMLTMRREILERLKSMVSTLPDVEKRLVELVYFDGQTLQDAGSQLGFSKSWTSRLHAKVLEKLAAEMKRLGLHDS
ncbi:MAG: sigma-70 family RNA polymerase sigma factor [Pirellulales bacterium]